MSDGQYGFLKTAESNRSAYQVRPGHRTSPDAIYDPSGPTTRAQQQLPASFINGFVLAPSRPSAYLTTKRLSSPAPAMATFRTFTRATRHTTFFTSTTAPYSTARNARNMSAVEEVVRTHGFTVIKGLAVAGVGGALISRFMMSSADAEAPGAGTKKVFGRAGPVFTSLALQSTEDVTSDVKRLRFKLPGDSDITGLPLTCECCTRTAKNRVRSTDRCYGG